MNCPQCKSTAVVRFSPSNGEFSSGQGGHAGGGVASEEELNRPGTHYIVKRSGDFTYHGKSFAPEETPAGAAHVTVFSKGKFIVNAGTLSPSMETSLKNNLLKN